MKQSKYTQGNITLKKAILNKGKGYYLIVDKAEIYWLSEKELNDLSNCIFLSRGHEIIDGKNDVVPFCTCGELSEKKSRQ